MTTTLVVSTALATRDFQDVHHDRELARKRGSKDIFLNILTTTGLVQRYVTEWAGHGVQVRCFELRLGAPAHPATRCRSPAGSWAIEDRPRSGASSTCWARTRSATTSPAPHGGGRW